jgi:hypothetical protein
MGTVRGIRDGLVHAVLGALGLMFGALGAVVMTIAAIVSAALGMLAFLFSPIRALVDRLHP